MKKIVSTITLFITIHVIIMSMNGCNCNPNYDHSLITVDSALSHDNAKEAKRLLDSIGDNVSGSANRAYKALLTTESNYRNYIDDTTDAVINEALDYYTDHKSDRRKYIHCLMYKGIISELIGQQRDAIDWLNKAKNQCDTSDYNTIGYINLRMADLYNNQFLMDKTAFELYQNALVCFEKAHKERYQTYCLNQLAFLSLRENKKKTHDYINRGYKKSLYLADRSYYFENRTALAACYNDVDKDYVKCKDVAVTLIKEHKELLDSTAYKNLAARHYMAYYWAALSYAHLGIADSAQYYLNFLPLDTTPLNRHNYLYLASEIAYLNQNYKESKNLTEQRHHILDSVLINTHAFQMREIEQKYDKSLITEKYAKLKQTQYLLILLIVSFLLIATIFGIIIRNRNQQNRNELNLLNDELSIFKRELLQSQTILIHYTHNLHSVEEECSKQQNKLTKTSNALAKFQQENENLQTVVMQYLTIVSNIVEILNISINDKSKISRVTKVVDELFTTKQSFWDDISSLVNIQYPTLHQEICNIYPQIKEKEIRLLNLLVLHFPTKIIITLLRIPSLNALYVQKNRIVKHLAPLTLDDFLTKIKDK